MITYRFIVVFCLHALVVALPAADYPADDNVLSTDLSSEPRAVTYPCKCEGSRCSCCSGNVLQNFGLNLFRQLLCTNITYDPDDFEFNVRVVYNDFTVFHRVVSGRNPRPICVPIFPPAWTQSRVCIKFSNVYFVGRNVHLCLGMEAQTEEKPVFGVDFNCIRMGTQGVALLKPEDGGGLPVPIPDEPNDPTVESSTAQTASTAAAAVATPETDVGMEEEEAVATTPTKVVRTQVVHL